MGGWGNSKPEAVLIVAFSGRALAASAHRAGYMPLVADLFADADTAELAMRNIHVEGDLTRGFSAPHMLAALDELAAHGPKPLGVVYGAGFEARLDLLEEIGKRWRILGNAPVTVARLKAPRVFADCCARLGIPHPEITVDPPAEPKGWLRKLCGGAGGSHIVFASHESARPARDCEGFYYQRRVAGQAISASFLATRHQTHIIGFSEQWRAPNARDPFRFGGAVRPAWISSALRAELTEAIARIAAEFDLTGLNSADFIVGDEGEWWLLEINPRPGATLDIFDMGDPPLFALHLEAAFGETIPAVPTLRGAAATQIVYASQAISVPPDLRYPSWTVDRPRPGVGLMVNDPFCTVLAQEENACEAKALCAERGRHWQTILEDELWIKAS
jgi:uncharacterized protein